MNVTLHSEHYEVIINSIGAELKSFKNPSGKEFVWTSDPVHWMRSSPLLFPTIGNVRNGETCFNGTSYAMPKHGFCKDSEFEITAQTENSATFTLRSSEETLAVYPFRFELNLTYVLLGSTLSMTYTVTNTDAVDLPYHIGAHPGFLCPLEEWKILPTTKLYLKKKKLCWLLLMIWNICASMQISRFLMANIPPGFL